MTSVLWFQGGACSGNTMSFINASEPTVVDLIVDFGLEVIYHPTLSSCWSRKKWDNSISQKVKIGGVFKLDRPRQRSKEELRLAAELSQVFPVDFEHDAVRVRTGVGNQPFVTPDAIIPALRVAVEWDGAAHRSDPSIDLLKEKALRASGWTTVRASVHISKSKGNTIAAPTGLTLGVVRAVMDSLLERDATFADAVGEWHAVGRWQGTALYNSLVSSAGHSVEGTLGSGTPPPCGARCEAIRTSPSTSPSPGQRAAGRTPAPWRSRSTLRGAGSDVDPPGRLVPRLTIRPSLLTLAVLAPLTAGAGVGNRRSPIDVGPSGATSAPPGIHRKGETP